MKTKSTAFIINSSLFPGYGRNRVSSPTCQKCNLGTYKIYATNERLKLTCDRCLYEIHYMRINRND